MIKKRIAYTDYNGIEREEDFWFNLSKAEVTEMEMTITGGLLQMLQKIIDAKDNVKIIEVFKDVLLRSYGEKSPDGKRFIKSTELSEAFSQTEAYSILFMELAFNTEAAIAFVNGIMPVNIDDSVKVKN